MHESNGTRVVSHVDVPLICAKPATLENSGRRSKKREALNPREPVMAIAEDSRGRMLGHCSTAERKSSDDALNGTEEFEYARRDVCV